MNWLQQLLLAVVRNIYVNGVLQQFVPGLNFGSGFSVAINSALGYATVTNTGSSATPVPAVATSSTGSISSPTSNATYNVTSSADVTLTVTGTPSDGVTLTFVDISQSWATYPFTFVSQSGGTVRNPGNLSGSDGNSAVLNLAGASVTFKWNATGSKWTAI